MPRNTNPFYVHPGADFGDSLKGLTATVARVNAVKRAEQKEQEEKDRVALMTQGAVEVYRTGDPDKIAEYSFRNPEIAKILMGASKFRNERTKENYSNSLFAGIQDPGKIPDIVASRQAFLQSQGVGPEGSQETDSFLEKYNADPAKTVQNMKKELAFIAPAKWKAYKDAQEAGDYEGLSAAYETYLRANELTNTPGNYKKFNAHVVSQKKLAQKTPDEYPLLSKLMADGWLPSQRITAPLLQAYESAAKKAEEQGTPLTPDALYEMEFQAQRNRATGRTAGSRLVLARKQNIEAANGLLKDLKATSAKLNYSPVKFIASIEKFKKGQMVDPIFTEYMTQRADSLFILGNALKQNGLTDKSIEVEEEAFSPTLSPEAFNAWYNTQLRALNRAAEEMNRDFKYGIPTYPTFPAGQGGAPTAENPVPAMPTRESMSGAGLTVPQTEITLQGVLDGINAQRKKGIQ